MVFFITGLSGSGKTTAAGFFQRLGIPVVRMGDVTMRSLRSRYAPGQEQREEDIRRGLRQRYGPLVYAQRTVPSVVQALKTTRDVAVEGVRSIEEWDYFRTTFSNSQLIYLQADRDIRHKRLRQREIRPLNTKEIAIRDAWEQEIGVERLKAVANYVVENNGTEEKLQEALKRIMKQSLNY